MRARRLWDAYALFSSFAAFGLASCSATNQPFKDAHYYLPEQHCLRPNCYGGGRRRHLSSKSEKASTISQNIDIKQTCRSAARFSTSSDINYCLNDEKTALLQMQRQRRTFSNAAYANCKAQSLSYNPSYVEMLTCLELSQNIAPGINPFAKTNQKSLDIDATGSVLPLLGDDAKRHAAPLLEHTEPFK